VTNGVFAALDAGDPEPLRAALRCLPAWDEWSWGAVWSAACCVLGSVPAVLMIDVGAAWQPASLSLTPAHVTSPEPRNVANAEPVAQALGAALAGPLGIESHRRAARAELALLLEGRVEPERRDAVAALLSHHGGGPVDVLDGRPYIGPGSSADLEAVITGLEPLCGLLDDPIRFRAELEIGARSDSPARRTMMRRLLALG